MKMLFSLFVLFAALNVRAEDEVRVPVPDCLKQQFQGEKATEIYCVEGQHGLPSSCGVYHETTLKSEKVCPSKGDAEEVLKYLRDNVSLCKLPPILAVSGGLVCKLSCSLPKKPKDGGSLGNLEDVLNRIDCKLYDISKEQ